MIYISGKITGTEDYLDRFSDAEFNLVRQGYNVMNPAKIMNDMPKSCKYEDYMKVAMTLLSLCDEIYMLDGWEKSCGANREYGYALATGMNVTFEK